MIDMKVNVYEWKFLFAIVNCGPHVLSVFASVGVGKFTMCCLHCVTFYNTKGHLQNSAFVLSDCGILLLYPLYVFCKVSLLSLTVKEDDA